MPPVLHGRVVGASSGWADRLGWIDVNEPTGEGIGLGARLRVSLLADRGASAGAPERSKFNEDRALVLAGVSKH